MVPAAAWLALSTVAALAGWVSGYGTALAVAACRWGGEGPGLPPRRLGIAVGVLVTNVAVGGYVVLLRWVGLF